MSKKLISVLVVLALALSMVFVVGLPATEVEAATANYTQNLFPVGTTGTQTAKCPVCKEEVEWYDFNKLTGTVGGTNSDHESHYYLSDDFTAIGSLWYGNLITIEQNLCLHLNGYTLTTGSRLFPGSAYTANLIAGNGGGVVFTNAKDMGAFFTGGGTTNVYGGTYTVTPADGHDTTTIVKHNGYVNFYDATLNGDIAIVDNAGIARRTTLYGTTTVNGVADFSNTGSLGLGDGWSGSIREYKPHSSALNTTTGLFATNRITAEGTITGIIGYADGKSLVWNGSAFALKTADESVQEGNLFPAGTTGTQTADCPACGGPQTWYELNTIGGTDGMNADKTKTHYYLSADYTMGSTWYGNLFGTQQGRDICFHLNGKQLTAKNRFFTSDLKTLNIIAGNNGRVIYNGGDNSPLFYTGTFNVYGGTYTDTTGAGIAKLNNGALNFYDVTVNGNVIGAAGIGRRTTLYGTTTINGVADFSATGSLGLGDGWSGSITEYVPYYDGGLNTITGVLAADRINAAGAITGTINGGLVWNGSNFISTAFIVKGDKLVPYPSAQAAVDAYTKTDYQAKNVIRLLDSGSVVLAAEQNYYIDANGNDVTVTGTGTLHPMDSANDRYDADKCGKWTISGVTIKNDVECGNRYITIKEGNVYTAHRLEMKLTHVTLRTFNAGLYFKAEYKCDDTLAKRVTRYGVAVSKNGIPEAVGGAGVGYSELTTGFAPEAISHSLNTNSGAVVGIFNTGAETDNKTRAETPIGARVYFTVDLDGTNNTLDCLSAEGGSYSLYDVLNAIDTGWGNYNKAQRTTVHNFYNAWKGKGASDCRIENLGFTKLPNTNELEYELKVGYAYFDITPTGDVTSLILGGRGSSVSATGVVDKYGLPGTCVAFTDENGQTVLMYTLDLLYVSDEIVKFAADIATETGVPESNILINGTHSHSAPHPVSALYPQNAAYINGLKQKMIDAGEAAIADQKAAKMYTASVKAPNMNSVRHYLMSDGTVSGDNFGNRSSSVTVLKPVEDADNEIQLIKFVRDGSDILLMNWQGHPNRPGQTDEDYQAILSGLELMRAELAKPKHDMLLAFFLGASGNVNNSSRISGEIPTQNDYTAHYAALLQKALTASFKEVSVGKLQVLSKTVSLVARDKNSLKNMSIYGFSVGDVAFVIAPYEMFNASGLFIKENSPYDTTFVSTCSMGTSSYIPTDEVYDFKVTGVIAGENHPVYEANGCPVVRGSAEILAKEYVTLLRELKAG